MNRFRNYLSRIPDRPLAEAVSRTYHALFEGLTPQQKARRAIRAILNPPPGGWDSPARRTDGSEFVSEHGTTLTWDQVLETYLRGLIFRDKAIAPKFEPGVARIAYGELGIWPEDIEDFRTNRTDSVPLGQFRAILHMLSGEAHANEYDFDLNGMHYGEMVERFGRSSEEAEADDTEDTGVLNYEIVHIPDFETAQEYAKYTNHWCVCEHRNYFNRYTARGKNTFYMLFAPGFDKMKDVHGENYPKDEYGLSVIGPMIAPDGSVEYCCVRRNHDGGMGDHALTEKELSQLLGRPVRTVLPHIDSEDATGLIARITAKLAKGISPEEIYGGGGEVVWDNATMYRMNDCFVLVDNRTHLPMVDYEISSWDHLDSRAISAYIVAGTDDYGDDQYLSVLIRNTGAMYAIGGSPDIQDEWDPLYYDAIRYISTTGFTGLYQVRLDNGYDTDECLMYLPGVSGPYGITGPHEQISVYTADGLIVCDPNSSTVDSGEGDLHIIKWSPDGNYRELLGSDTLSSVPEHLYVYDDKLPDGKVIIVYVDSDYEIRLIRDGEDIGTDVYAEDMGYIDSRLMPGLLWLQNDEEYAIFSIPAAYVVVDHLPEQPDDYGVYTLPDGKKNMVTENGILLKEPVDRLEVVGGLKTPIGYQLSRDTSNGKNRGNYFACAGTPEGDYWVDIETGNRLYDRPLPDSAYPYTENLYIGPAGEDGNRRAMFNLDGKQTSCEFDKVSTTCEFIEKCDGDKCTGYNIVNPETGKELFPFWLKDQPKIVGRSFDTETAGVGKLACTREDGKKLLVLAVTPVSSNSEGDKTKCGYTSFRDSGIGWHDYYEAISNYPAAVFAHDSTTGEFPAPLENRTMTGYDLRTGKHTGTYPARRLMATIRAMTQAYGQRMDGMGIAKSFVECPDWTEWLDSHIDTAERWMED